MEINFELYKIFYMVANCNSISKGAEKLFISQPAVTQAIKNLEGQLGVTLFIRTKRGILLTREGEELYSYVKEGMNYFVNGTNKLLELKRLETGMIRIGATTTVTENFLLPYVKRFHQLYPKLEIKIVNQLTDTLLRELRNGSLDIVVGSESFQEGKELSFYPLQEIEYILVSNRPLELSWNEVLGEKWIVPACPSVARNVLDSFLQEKGVSCSIGMEVVSHRLVTEFVKSGMGIGWVTKQYVLKELERGELYEVLIAEDLPKRKIGYTVKKHFVPSFAVKALIDLFESKE